MFYLYRIANLSSPVSPYSHLRVTNAVHVHRNILLFNSLKAEAAHQNGRSPLHRPRECNKASLLKSLDPCFSCDCLLWTLGTLRRTNRRIGTNRITTKKKGHRESLGEGTADTGGQTCTQLKLLTCSFLAFQQSLRFLSRPDVGSTRRHHLWHDFHSVRPNYYRRCLMKAL